jgi:hypothetical protein
VRAYNAVGDSAYSNESCATTVSAPPNDNFTNAQVISGSSGTVTGSNVGATKEAGEPNHAGNAGGASVWYRWTAPSSGSATIDTIGSSFDTLLAVYTGSAVNSLTEIASNDDSGGLQSRVTFTAVSGTTYQIAVDGYNGVMGNITLNWSLAAACTNTSAIFRVERATGNACADGSWNAGGADVAERIDVSEPVEPGDLVEIDPTQPKHYRKTRGPSSTLVAGVIVVGSGVVLANLSKEFRPIELFNKTQPLQSLPTSWLLSLNTSSILKWSIASLAEAQTQGMLKQAEMRVSISIGQLLQRRQLSTLGQPLLALMGRVKVKATTENGPIRPGDLLVSAATPGYVMRCPNPQECEGAIVGKALEPLEEGAGLILILIMH